MRAPPRSSDEPPRGGGPGGRPGRRRRRPGAGRDGRGGCGDPRGGATMIRRTVAATVLGGLAAAVLADRWLGGLSVDEAGNPIRVPIRTRIEIDGADRRGLGAPRGHRAPARVDDRPQGCPGHDLRSDRHRNAGRRRHPDPRHPGPRPRRGHRVRPAAPLRGPPCRSVRAARGSSPSTRSTVGVGRGSSGPRPWSRRSCRTSARSTQGPDPRAACSRRTWNGSRALVQTSRAGTELGAAAARPDGADRTGRGRVERERARRAALAPD